jgi:hypothetical protein
LRRTILGLERRQVNKKPSRWPQIKRWWIVDAKSRNVRLGTLTELPTKAAARNKLADQLRNSDPSVEMNFCELSQRWQTVAMPTLKTHHRRSLSKRSPCVYDSGVWQAQGLNDRTL